MMTKLLACSTILTVALAGVASARPRNDVLEGHAGDVHLLLDQTRAAREALTRGERARARDDVRAAIAVEATFPAHVRFASLDHATVLDLGAARRELTNARAMLDIDRPRAADHALAQVASAVIVRDKVAATKIR